MKDDKINSRIEQRLQERQRKEQKMKEWEQKSHRNFRFRPLYFAIAIAACLAVVFVLVPWNSTTPTLNTPSESEMELFRGGDATIENLVEEGAYEEAIEYVDSLIEIQDRLILGLELYGDYDEELDYELESHKQKRQDLKAMRKKIKKIMKK